MMNGEEELQKLMSGEEELVGSIIIDNYLFLFFFNKFKLFLIKRCIAINFFQLI